MLRSSDCTQKTINNSMFSGVWSATPTPFTETMAVDKSSVKRLVEHHLRLGVKGLFLCGTCGEGPWMTEQQRCDFIDAVVKYAKGRLHIAAQVTDNSAPRILDNIKMVSDCGADIAVVAPPFFMDLVTPQILETLYLTVIEKSSLPIGIYDRGKFSSVFVPPQILKKIYAHPRVMLAKDSSSDPERMNLALRVRSKRKELVLLNGNEFDCVSYIKAGYDGLLLGGGIFNGYMAACIIEAVKAGDIRKAEKLQQRMNDIMFKVFGGKDCHCWLSGEKKLMVDLGVFRTWKGYLGYPLTLSCCKAIKTVIKENADMLTPWKV
jgi:4-hydroxy-tetrahydrodipicolinate synthase